MSVIQKQFKIKSKLVILTIQQVKIFVKNVKFLKETMKLASLIF